MTYELFTHQKPYPGDTTEEVLRKMLDPHTKLIPPGEYNPYISKELEKILMKCLERDPEKRYPHMGVVIRYLQEAP